jgi:hypothetical protein
MQDILSTPFAVSSNNLQGKIASDFVQVSGSVSQSKIETISENTFYNKLLSVINNQSFATDSGNPAGSDLVTKNYCDSRIGGKTAPGYTSGAGKFLKYNGTQWVLEAVSLSGGAVTSADIAGALGYTPQAENSGLTAIANLTSTGLLSRDGASSYSVKGLTAPLVDSGTSVGLALDGSGGLKLNAGTLAVNFGTVSGSVAAGNDSRIVNAVQTDDSRLPAVAGSCASGSFNRWNGSAWVCEAAASATAAVSVKTANYSILETDDIITTGSTNLTGAVTFTLPTAVGKVGKMITVKKTEGSAHAVTVNTVSSQTIDGAADKVINTPFGYVTLYSDGANWLIFSEKTSAGALLACTKVVTSELNTINALPIAISVTYSMVGGGGGKGGSLYYGGGGGGSSAILKNSTLVNYAAGGGGGGASDYTVGSNGTVVNGQFLLEAGATLRAIVGGGGGSYNTLVGGGGGGGAGYYGGGGGGGGVCGGASYGGGGAGGSNVGGAAGGGARAGTDGSLGVGGQGGPLSCSGTYTGAATGLTGGANGGGGGYGSGGGSYGNGGSNGGNGDGDVGLGANNWSNATTLPAAAGQGGQGGYQVKSGGNAGLVILTYYASQCVL